MDGYVTPAFAPGTYRSGQEAAIPMMFGSNGRDAPGLGQVPANATPDEIRATVKSRIDTAYAQYPDLADRAQKAYGVGAGGGDAASSYPPYGSLFTQYGVDHSMRCEAVTIAGWHSAVAPTWQYEFNAGTAAHPPVHSAELDFVFGYLRDQASDPKLVRLSEQMQQYWTNFAKTGDPNGPGLPAWPKFDARSGAYLELANDGPAARSGLRQATCAIFAERLTRDIQARRQ
jgi:para-nitrobenzyl esterase